MTLSCRIYLLCEKVGIPKAFRLVPAAKRPLTRLLRRLLPNKPVWVQVRSGIAEGLWMRLNLRKEVRLWLGEHEPALQAVLRPMIEPGMVVYDIGAHLGSIALGLARVLGGSGRVVAFEADPQNAENLIENRDRNGLQASLDIVPAAVWSHSSGAICFRRGGEKRSHGGVEAGGQRPVLGSGEIIKVSSISLDDFIVKGAPVPRLIKIDVEGGEYEVLRGASQLFSRQRPLLVAEVHHKQAEHDIRKWLEEFGYGSRWIAPPEQYPCCVFVWDAQSREEVDRMKVNEQFS
jgi:FkbM family methyltransferase